MISLQFILCAIIAIAFPSTEAKKSKSETTTIAARRPADGVEDGACPRRFVVTQAIADIESLDSSVSGSIQFDQPNGTGIVHITGAVAGLSPGRHGMHIHTFGNLERNCAAAGDHYNPDNFTHGSASSSVRHAGDLGNLDANEDGVATVDIQSRAFTLNGAFNVVGRSVVVHQNEDDLGKGSANDSAINGHSGDRIACGAIAISMEEPNPKFAGAMQNED